MGPRGAWGCAHRPANCLQPDRLGDRLRRLPLALIQSMTLCPQALAHVVLGVLALSAPRLARHWGRELLTVARIALVVRRHRCNSWRGGRQECRQENRWTPALTVVQATRSAPTSPQCGPQSLAASAHCTKNFHSVAHSVTLAATHCGILFHTAESLYTICRIFVQRPKMPHFVRFCCTVYVFLGKKSSLAATLWASFATLCVTLCFSGPHCGLQCTQKKPHCGKHTYKVSRISVHCGPQCGIKWPQCGD